MLYENIQTPITANWWWRRRRRRWVCVVIRVFFPLITPLLVWYETDDCSARRLANPNLACSDTTRERGPRTHFPFDTGGHQHMSPLVRVDEIYEDCRSGLTFVSCGHVLMTAHMSKVCFKTLLFSSAGCLVIFGARWISYTFYMRRFSCSSSGRIPMSPNYVDYWA